MPQRSNTAVRRLVFVFGLLAVFVAIGATVRLFLVAEYSFETADPDEVLASNDTIVFCLVLPDHDGGGRYRKETIELLGKLSPRQQFGIVFAGRELELFPESRRPVEATPDHVRAAQEWLRARELVPDRACTRDTLKFGIYLANFSSGRRKAILHVSFADCAHEVPDRRAHYEEIRAAFDWKSHEPDRLNFETEPYDPRVTVHCLGRDVRIGSPRAAFLEGLAADNPAPASSGTSGTSGTPDSPAAP